jgi:hypothetical protein
LPENRDSALDLAPDGARELRRKENAQKPSPVTVSAHSFFVGRPEPGA